MGSDFDKAYREAAAHRENARAADRQAKNESRSHRDLAQSLTAPYFDEVATKGLKILRDEGVRLGNSWVLPWGGTSFTLNKYKSNIFRKVWDLNSHGFLRLDWQGMFTQSFDTKMSNPEELFDAVRIGGQEIYESFRAEAISDYPRGPYLWFNTSTETLEVIWSSGQNRPSRQPFLEYGAQSVLELVTAWHERER